MPQKHPNCKEALYATWKSIHMTHKGVMKWIKHGYVVGHNCRCQQCVNNMTRVRPGRPPKDVEKAKLLEYTRRKQAVTLDEAR